MRGAVVMLVSWALGACSRPDACERFTSKAWHLFAAIDRPIRQSRPDFLTLCRAAEDRGLPDPERTEVMRCVDSAASEDATKQCLLAYVRSTDERQIQELFGSGWKSVPAQ